MTKAWLLALVFGIVSARAAEIDVPQALEDWQGWVLHGDETLQCPVRLGASPNDAAGRICAWPQMLRIDVTATGARFRQRWSVYADGSLPLPGGNDAWPVDVRIDQRAAVVLDRGGVPAVPVAAGDQEISGTITWQERPAVLAVPESVALLELVVDGQRVATPERGVVDGRSVIWLGERKAAAEESRVDVRVHRRLQDGLPGRIETRMLLNVSGPAREIVLGPVLPGDYRVLALTSELPVRLDADQRLRVQLRRGSWQVTLSARAPAVVDAFERPQAQTPWPAQETVSFAPDDALRIVTVDGVAPTDPAQAGVPEDWRGLVAYVLSAGDRLTLVERSRGLAGDSATRLSLHRDLWLGFDRTSWIARDRLQGQLSGRWRVGMQQPWQLESATSDGVHWLVTHLGDGDSGVELRTARVDLDSLATLPVGDAPMPATGWQHVLEAVTVQLHLPPGYRLIAALGVADASGDWLGRWSLLDIFLVLLVTVAAYRLLGVVGALVALPALALGYHEPLAPTWLWVNLVLAVALVRALPAGRLRRWAGIWRAVSFALMVVALLPFAFVQIRLALFPQLSVPTIAPFGATAVQELPAPSPPSQDMAQTMAPIEVTAIKAAQPRAVPTTDATASAPRRSLDYLPGTIAQTGPARPEWHYQEALLTFAPPVQPDQTLRVVIVPPWSMSVLRILEVLLAALLLLLLAGGVARGRSGDHAAARARMLAAALLVIVGWSMPDLAAHAQAQVPTPELLRELRARLLEPPDCAPECATLTSASLAVRGTQLLVALDWHAADTTAVPLPDLGDRGFASVAGPGGRAVPVAADAAGRWWALLEPGIGTLDLLATVDGRTELQVRFPLVPKRVAVDAADWSVRGTAEGRLLGDTVSMQRTVPAEAGTPVATEGITIPPFVRVRRHLTLDLDWQMSTIVERIAPGRGGFSLEVPLLEGESVTRVGDGVAIDGRVARVSFLAEERSRNWSATLAREDVIELAAAEDAPWTEVWRVAAGPAWHLEFTGTPEIGESGGGDARLFLPRSGEHLRIEVTRPETIPGASLVIDTLTSLHRVGPSATDLALDYQYRSTQGGRQLLRLPAGSALQEVIVDGNAMPLRLEQDVVALPVEPGEHAVTLRAQAPAGIAWRAATPGIDAGAPAGNVTTRVELPASRWILWTSGSGVGPAILYWSELVAFVALALLAGRLPHSPIRTHEWLLLGLGLSTFSWWVLIIFAAWLFAMRWRERTQLEDPLAFNLMQVLLAGFGVIALLALVSAIPNGLLGSPDMRIDGPGSHGVSLVWFDDQASGALPVKTVLSVSIWWYKLAMLAWALWLSLALVRWVPWAWRAYSSGDYWREVRKKAPRKG